MDVAIVVGIVVVVIMIVFVIVARTTGAGTCAATWNNVRTHLLTRAKLSRDAALLLLTDDHTLALEACSRGLEAVDVLHRLPRHYGKENRGHDVESIERSLQDTYAKLTM
jgi:hypothetical protein